MKYLEGLNDAQKRAVLAKDGPVSVLAGAGSGKTRVLTTRIYHLIREGVGADKILAVTFTNKAAREMRERVRKQLEGDTTLPFIATFHGLGRELLESYGRGMGIPRFFSVYDRDDSEKVISSALKALDVETKELSPRAVLARISRAKGEGMRANEFYEKQGRSSFGGRITAEAWLRYEKALAEEKALDFDDLIALPVRLLEEHADIRALVQDRWHYVHIDEYQDTNALQGRLANMLAAKHRNVFVVGDIDQCLVGGTNILLPDGSTRTIEKIKKDDLVLSNYGSGDMRPARVTRVTTRIAWGELVRVTTRSGKILTSTSDHLHFAGYRLGETPQLSFTYLMHKKGKGWRLGVSQTYTKGQRKPMIGFQQRCNHEHADEVWIIGVHDSQQDARILEYQLSLRYMIPTLPFVARKGGSTHGYVHDQEVLDRIFASFNTDAGARTLLSAEGLSISHPHHRAQGHTSAGRKNIVVTLCGDHRTTRTLHRIALAGNDEEGKKKLRNAGFSVRPARAGSQNWRFETAHKDYGTIERIIRELYDIFPESVLVRTARLGGHKKNPKDGNSLPFLPAGSLRRGMAMFDEEGKWDIVERVERIAKEKMRVYDLDIEGTHNFVANGIATHNCIYTWRGATIENLLEFDKKYPGAETILLAQNYRSTKNLVDAANAVIEKNKNRKEKYSTSDKAAGEPIVVHSAIDAEDEARWIALRIKTLTQEGVKPEDIAILFRTNFQSRALEEGLLRAGVPYKLLGTHFFARKEVKDTLAWMRLAMDPSREADKMRAAAFPSRGIGKVTLGKLAAGQRDALRAGELMKVEAFEKIIAELSHAATTLRPSEFVKLVIEKSGMRRALLDEGSEEDKERFENIEELASVAARYDTSLGKEGIALFIAEAALASDQDEIDQGEKRGVMLMTVHAAKGLEFGTVFVSGMEEGLFPHQAMGGDTHRDEEEERRLFYVAMTRAKERLILTFAHVRKIYGSDIYTEPSSFLADIDSALVRFEEGGAGGRYF
ncbi:MAG: 3'-5' exonuclease [Candidatus Pacebacteria bacterium]|nr:3'-5' exonuclease [Candidatus Paceibacterota bacterium]